MCWILLRSEDMWLQKSMNLLQSPNCLIISIIDIKIELFIYGYLYNYVITFKSSWLTETELSHFPIVYLLLSMCRKISSCLTKATKWCSDRVTVNIWPIWSSCSSVWVFWVWIVLSDKFTSTLYSQFSQSEVKWLLKSERSPRIAQKAICFPSLSSS